MRVTLSTLSVGLLLGGCSMPSDPGRMRNAVWASQARSLAAQVALACPSGASIVEHDSANGIVARGCALGMVRHGPFVEVNAWGANATVTHRRYERGVMVAETIRRLHDGRWSTTRDAEWSSEGVLLSFRRWQADVIVTEGAFPGGSGSFRATDQLGRFVAEGSCRDGARDGTWRFMKNDVEHVRTYRRGTLHGLYSDGPDIHGWVDEGRRVGRWRLMQRETRCLEWSSPGKLCGNMECLVSSSPASFSVTYDDTGKAGPVEDVVFDPASRGPRWSNRIEELHAPPAELDRGRYDCRSLVQDDYGP